MEKRSLLEVYINGVLFRIEWHFVVSSIGLPMPHVAPGREVILETGQGG
jgi:hypothetical protein